MKTKFRRVLSLLAVASLTGLSVFAGSAHLTAAEKAAAPSIDDVMKKAFKGKEKALVTIVSSGRGTPEQNKMMVEACEALAGQKPPKGDQKDWDKRCGDMLTAAKALAAGDKKAAMALKNAANCKGCHDLHKE